MVSLQEAVDKSKVDQVEEVLAWVNEQRTERELDSLEKLRSGVPKRLNECPIARSLSEEGDDVVVTPWGWTPEVGETDSSEWKPVPECVKDFTRRFDAGTAFQEYRAQE